MTEQKKSPNPFINMAREAKERATKITPEKAAQINQAKKAPKPTKGFGGAPVRKTGRGG